VGPDVASIAEAYSYDAPGRPGLAGSLETAKYEPIEQYATSDDVKEGRRAFAEKRAPNWTGR
jgi:1,4-dihydroxy-2-naphthoyl-CoA synthase